MQESASALVVQWLKRVRESQLTHYAAAERDSRKHLLIGVPAAIFSALIGTTIFSALDSKHDLDIRLKISVACISIITAILTGCQTFLRFSEKTDAHRSASSKYAEVRRQIEVLLTFPDAIDQAAVERIEKSIDEITKGAPTVSASVWKTAMTRAGNKFLFSDRLTAGD